MLIMGSRLSDSSFSHDKIKLFYQMQSLQAMQIGRNFTLKRINITK